MLKKLISVENSNVCFLFLFSFLKMSFNFVRNERGRLARVCMNPCWFPCCSTDIGNRISRDNWPWEKKVLETLLSPNLLMFEAVISSDYFQDGYEACHWDRNKLMRYLKHHNEFCFSPPFFYGFPLKLTKHLNEAASIMVSVAHKLRSSSLHNF